MESGGNAAPTRGIYDGFEAFRTPLPEEYHAVLTGGLVVPDANVLLSLYRYTDRARADLLSVMERLSDRLWVPNQVLAEFWRNRDRVLRDPRDTQRTKEDVENQEERVTLTLRTWANRVSLPDDRVAPLIDGLEKGFSAVLEEVERFNDDSAIDAARDTSKDDVLTRLDGILKGKVGAALDGDSYTAAVEEGLRRIEAEEPPGYKDKNKEDELAAGDYLVWEQLLIEAEQRGCDVAFVTADVKEDWWRREGGETRGPRPELVAELNSRAGSRLFMLRPTNLLEYGREALEVSVQDSSVEVANRVERLLLEKFREAFGGWNAAAIESLLGQLHEEQAVQAKVIEHAALNDGFIARETVYEIAGYESSRRLTGFTRPVARISRILREDGLIAEDAVELLHTVYDPDSANPNEASGFEINPAVKTLVLSIVEDRDGASS